MTSQLSAVKGSLPKISHTILVWCKMYRLNDINFVSQDTPGFIVNRLLVPYIMESIRMLERGKKWRMISKKIVIRQKYIYIQGVKLRLIQAPM